MEGCLLCLEINKEFVDFIIIESTKGQELKIKNIIDKHFWIMESLSPSSWVCHTCWNALYDFHKFYLRIEESHNDFGKLMKIEIEQMEDVKNINRGECKNLNENYDVFDSHVEPEILIEELVMENHKPIIKEEQDKDLPKDNIPIIQRPKRKHMSKDTTNDIEPTSEDPLTNYKTYNHSKRKCRKKETSVESSLPIKSSYENSDNATLQTLHYIDSLQIPDKSKLSRKSSDDSSDSEYKPIRKNTRRKQTKKKPTHKNETLQMKQSPNPSQMTDKSTLPLISSDYGDYNTDSDYDDYTTDSDYKPPEEDCPKPPKQSSKEKDKFLSENFQMSCVLCQIPMETFKNLIKHFEMTHNTRGYAVCCDKNFYERSLLLEHVFRHVNPSDFKCNQCDKVVSSRKALKSHQLVHLSDGEKKFACNKCDKTYVKQNLLSYHISLVHLKKYLKICDICGKSIRNATFERHMLEHEGKPIPQVNCEICGVRLSDKKILRRHMINQHPVGEKQLHTCHICCKISPNRAALKEHIRRIHNMPNKHKCNMCGKGFKRILALKEHMATHTGIALYTCPWCPKTFNANSSMYTHRKTQHPIEWEQDQRQKKIEKYKNTTVMEVDKSYFS